jgi:hypothetical protein
MQSSVLAMLVAISMFILVVMMMIVLMMMAMFMMMIVLMGMSSSIAVYVVMSLLKHQFTNLTTTAILTHL